MLFRRPVSFDLFLLLLTSKVVNPNKSAEQAKNEQSEKCVPCRQSFFWHFTPQYATCLHPPQNSAVRHSIGLLQQEQLPSFKSITDERISKNCNDCSVIAWVDNGDIASIIWLQ
jgi:hypothetical protein